MAERRIRHVEEIFSGRGVGDGAPSHIFEKKSGFNNVFKNKRAPAPPQGQNALPKIGNYQPKTYLEPIPGAPLENHSKPIVISADVHKENGDVTNNVSRDVQNDVKAQEINKEMFIIGDKDIPIIIEEKSDLRNTQTDEEVFDGDSSPVPAPRRKRRAPSAPDVSEPTSTNNPLFGRSLSQSSDKTRLDNDFDTQGGDIDFAYGIDNPGYQTKDYVSTRPDYSPAPSLRKNDFHKSEGDLPYIPPPDYDDEELTMDFGDEPEIDPEERILRNRPGSLYNDYEGEDYGKYLNDDLDYKIEQSRHSRGQAFMDPDGRDQKFLPKAPPRDKRKGNKTKKHSKKDSDMKRNTIRDFTFTDSKIGWGDRTVKSTSAKGRYIKREKGRGRIDMTEDTENFSGAPAPGSYEDFLRMKNTLNMDSPNSSDSGVEVGDESQLMDMYLHSQPKQYKMASKYDNRKPSVWKRLTLRFKKSVNVSNSGNNR